MFGIFIFFSAGTVRYLAAFYISSVSYFGFLHCDMVFSWAFFRIISNSILFSVSIIIYTDYCRYCYCYHNCDDNQPMFC